jgi:predicted HNH restriction endonuclease
MAMNDPQRQPEIESQNLYEEFLRDGTVSNSAAQYVINLKRLARLMNRKISPTLFRGGTTAKSIVSGLPPQRSSHQMQTALERYSDMVVKDFRGAFPRGSARAAARPQRLVRKNVAALTSDGGRLLEAIVGYCQFYRVDSQRPATYPTYGELYRVIVPNSPSIVLHVGRHLRRKGLDDLNRWTQENPTFPKITGIIVNKATRRPHNNFFLSHNRTPIRDDRWWRDEVQKSLAFDWSPYLSESGFTFDDVSAVTNVSEGAKSARTIILRQRSAKLRAAAIAHYKAQNGGKLICYLSKWSAPDIPLNDAIIELHHLKALGGRSAKGVTMPMKEAIELLRPVSPNIHRMLHSKPGGGCYSIEEFIALTAKEN